MRTKVLILLLIVLQSSYIFFGCSSETNNETASQTGSDTQPVSFHHYFSGSLSGGIADMVEVYNQDQGIYNLKVVPIDHEAYKVSIHESFKNKTPADMNSYWAGARTMSVIEHLEPLDDVFESSQLIKNFQPSLLRSSSIYNDHYYLLPITQHYVCFFYNKSTFERHGLEEPTNWEEFITVCETLKRNDITPIGLGAKNRWPAQFWFDYLLLRTAGDSYRDSLLDGNASYEDPEVKTVMKQWKLMIDRGYFNDNAADVDWDLDIIEQIMQGQYGMTLMGTWLLSILDAEGYEGQYGVFSFPVIDASIPVAALGPVDGVILGKDAINLEGAKDAIVHFADADNQKMMAMGSGGFAPNIHVERSIYSALQLKLLDDIDKSDAWAFNYDLATKPEKAELGLEFFVEFLVFPDAYEFLLSELETNMNDR